MERVFCKKCGNKTLRRVSVSVNADGSLTYHLPKRRRPFNLRGTKVGYFKDQKRVHRISSYTLKYL